MAKIKAGSQAANYAKSRLLSNMSHELLTPLNDVVGMADLLLETSLVPEQREYCHTIKQSAGVLLRVIDNVLDFAKYEDAKPLIAQSPFNLGDFLEGLLSSFRPLAKRKNLDLTFSLPEEIDLPLLGDPVCLRKILANLIENAIKFTDKGEIRVKVLQEEFFEDALTLRFSIVDTGIGVPEEHVRSIFDAFFQADNSRTRRSGGTGLGLTIASRIAESMGGRIWLDSELGRGSTFHFNATFKALERKEKKEKKSDVESWLLPSLRVLLAEDNLINQKVLTRIFEKRGHSISIASDGEQAVAIWENQPIDLILMDISMPVKDGLAATAEIRLREKDGDSRTPIVAFTAHSLEEDAAQCLEAGMDAFVPKPLDCDQLFHVIRKVLGS